MTQKIDRIDWFVFNKDRDYMTALRHVFTEKHWTQKGEPLKFLLSELPPAVYNYYNAVMNQEDISVKLIKDLNRALVTAMVSKDLPEGCFDRHPLFLPVFVAGPYFTGHAYLPYEIVDSKLRIIYPKTEKLLVGHPAANQELETLTGL